jgi:hypothetical protein
VARRKAEEIRFASRERGIIGLDLDLPAPPEHDFIIEGDPVKDGQEVVVAILPAFDNPEPEVDLCIGPDGS